MDFADVGGVRAVKELLDGCPGKGPRSPPLVKGKEGRVEELQEALALEALLWNLHAERLAEDELGGEIEELDACQKAKKRQIREIGMIAYSRDV